MPSPWGGEGAVLITGGPVGWGWRSPGIWRARVIVGSERQLALLPEGEAEHRPWPSPIAPLVDELVDAAPPGTCVLASGDPMLHGIGATLARRLGPERIEVHPHPSALALACARLGWPEAEVDLVNLVGRPPETAAALFQPGRRIVAYVDGADGAARFAALLRERGFGASRLAILEQLGGPGEVVTETTASAWDGQLADPLHAVAAELAPDAGTPLLSRSPGLPDDAYENDGQISKRAVRAHALALLAPAPRRLLWDVGAGSGSIAIEWLRAEPTAGAVAIEARADRAERVAANAARLGVPRLAVVHGEAPAALADLDPPDAVFVGGGLSAPGLLDACWEALRPGGRLVASAVTLEGEATLAEARARHGGELVRLSVEQAEPLGELTGWRPQRAVVHLLAEKGSA